MGSVTSFSGTSDLSLNSALGVKVGLRDAVFYGFPYTLRPKPKIASFVVVWRSQTRARSARVWSQANMAFCTVGMQLPRDYIIPNKFLNSCFGSW